MSIHPKKKGPLSIRQSYRARLSLNICGPNIQSISMVTKLHRTKSNPVLGATHAPPFSVIPKGPPKQKCTRSPQGTTTMRKSASRCTSVTDSQSDSSASCGGTMKRSQAFLIYPGPAGEATRSFSSRTGPIPVGSKRKMFF